MVYISKYTACQLL